MRGIGALPRLGTGTCGTGTGRGHRRPDHRFRASRATRTVANTQPENCRQRPGRNGCLPPLTLGGSPRGGGTAYGSRPLVRKAAAHARYKMTGVLGPFWSPCGTPAPSLFRKFSRPKSLERAEFRLNFTCIGDTDSSAHRSGPLAGHKDVRKVTLLSTSSKPGRPTRVSTPGL